MAVVNEVSRIHGILLADVKAREEIEMIKNKLQTYETYINVLEKKVALLELLVKDTVHTQETVTLNGSLLTYNPAESNGDVLKFEIEPDLTDEGVLIL